MTLGDVVAKVRRLINEPTTDRFTAADMAQVASDAQRQLFLEIKHPESIIEIPLLANVKEYQLPAVTQILRVYVQTPEGAMQTLYGTDMDILEGQIQQEYDNTSGLILGAQPESPQWLVQQPRAYPIRTWGHGNRVPTKNIYENNSRPAYYMRGGYLGLTTPPIQDGYTLVINCYQVMPDLFLDSDVFVVPLVYKDALTWYMVREFCYGDKSSGFQEAETNLGIEKMKLKKWKYELQKNNPQFVYPLTNRRGGRRRRGYWR
jgi:hypothetical protein